jgi:hypothetical protein
MEVENMRIWPCSRSLEADVVADRDYSEDKTVAKLVRKWCE